MMTGDVIITNLGYCSFPRAR